MSRILSVVTPENVEVQFELAGLGSRFLAAMLDYMVVFGTGALLVWGFLVGAAVTYHVSGTWLIGICTLLVFVCDWCYFIGFEGLRRGQTPGKSYVGLRVLRDGGFPLDMKSAMLRNFLRAIDFLPSLYCVGTIASFCSPDNKRLGDMAAGTVVVRERAATPMAYTVDTEVRHPESDVLSKLTPVEVSVVREFVSRRDTLAPHIADSVGNDIAHRLSQHLGVTVTAHALPTLLADYDKGS